MVNNTNLKPKFSKPIAVALPIPEFAPVIMQIFPFIKLDLLFSVSANVNIPKRSN